MAFGDWLASLERNLAQIAGLTNDCATLAHADLVKAQAVHASAVSYSNETAHNEGVAGRAYRCNNCAGDIRADLFSLYHEVEMAVDWSYILSRGGVDKDHVLDPIDGSIGGGYGYHFAQNGPLVVSPAPGSASEVISSGQTGLKVPIDLKLLSRDLTGDVGLTIDFVTTGVSPAFVSVAIARPPHLLTSDAIAHELQAQIEDRASAVVGSLLHRVSLMTPVLDVFPRQPQFWGTFDNGLVRVVGKVLGRQRNRRPFLATLPGGFPVATRFDAAVIMAMISQQVASAGAQIFSGPTVTSDKSFSMVAGVRQSRSLKIGCDVASATVTISVTIQGSLAVRRGNVLSVDAQPVGNPNVDVDIRPSIPILTNWVDGIVADFIRLFIPAISGFSTSFMLSGVTRADIWLTNDYATLGLVPS